MADMLTEQGFIVRFIEAVFDSVVRERNQAIRKAAEKDPEFRRIINDLERSKKKLAQWAVKRKKEDPAFRRADSAFRAIGLD
jgi:TRAP-type mannitol/chloroaromatic compound transport system substrate-binding protein